MFKKKSQCTFLSTHSLIQQVGMNINFMPSIVVGTGDAAVNKRQKILPSWSLYSSITRKTNKYMSGYAKCYGEKQGKVRGLYRVVVEVGAVLYIEQPGTSLRGGYVG